MGRLQDRVAIVTGGARVSAAPPPGGWRRRGRQRTHRSTSTQGGAEGNVAAHPRGGGTAELLAGDVGKREDIRAMVARAVARWGRLDILVNNAYGSRGSGAGGGAVEVTEEAWDEGWPCW